MRRRIWVTVTAFVAALTVLPSPMGLLAEAAPSPERRGDFNGDGYHDLAIGVEFEDVGSDDDAGGVEVIYGTQNGLNGDAPIDDQFLTQGTLSGSVEPGDRFGHALAWGDFDADGFDDLAIGAPFEDVQISTGNMADAGVVHVAYGSPSGLTAFGDVVLTQNSQGILGVVQTGDRFGFALAAGNLGAGAGDELAIGTPRDRVGSVSRAGAVNVLYGGFGVGSGGNQLWHQDSAGISGVAEISDEFGSALAIGDVGTSARADLAVGVPLEDLNTSTEADAGSVNVIYGGRNGLTSQGNQLWHQNSAGVGGGAEPADHFGAALTTGEFGRESTGDLAIGVPGEDAGGAVDAGVAQVLYGTATGLAPAGNQIWYLNSSGVPGAAADGDAFGSALAAGDLGRDARDDLAVGIPFDDPDESNAGSAIVVYGSATGLSTSSVQAWTQGSSGIAGAPEKSDAFGQALAIADFGRGPESDLAVGVPGEGYEDTFPVLEVISLIGAVNVIYGADDGLNSSGSQFWWQRSGTLKDSGEASDRFGSALA
ncbi:MAG: hypothetical protein WD739_00550 [Actinomycetota bacterium]